MMPAAEVMARRSLGELVRRRVDGTYVIDPWGHDPDLFAAVEPMARLRFSVDVRGASHLPAAGPALVVANRRFGLSEPFAIALGLHAETGRLIRVAGVPDIAPVGPMGRRLGGVLGRPDEVRGLLADGQVVVVFADHMPRHPGRVGAVRTSTVQPALDEGAPVLPLATAGNEIGRRWVIALGAPVRRRSHPGPLALADLADGAHRDAQVLLDQLPVPRWPVG